jgi:Tol biopolymer transport system component
MDNMSHAEAPAVGPGTLLGAYQLEAKIGAGGMGQVWRARDTRLDRMVAVKVLPPQLAVRADFQERFQREAKALSALKHPNICLLYDIGEDKGVRYLVMELLEGSPPRGPMPAAALRRCASEIASALDAAHRSGLIHRDLKPGNVLVTAAGAKLLDFGLAKSIQPSDSDPDATKTEGLTQEGAIMGTFFYMAPEQVEGRAAGPRADIWAFGAVLYELATGRKAFEGATQAAIIGNILHSEPPPADIPPGLDRIIRRCLQKDPEERWQTARDLVIELRDMDKAPAPTARAGGLVWPWKAAAGALALAVLVDAALHLRRAAPPPAQPSVRFEVAAPRGHRIVGGQRPRISPDGTKLAFVARDIKETTNRIWVRPLDSTEAFPLAGTDGARNTGLVWSADGEALAYSIRNSLMRASISGGTPTRLVARDLQPTAWSRDGFIYANDPAAGPVFRVLAKGGDPSPVTKLDQALGETGHFGFTLSPDERHYIYRTGPNAKAGVFLGSFDGAPNKRIEVPGGSAVAAYVQGHLMFNRGEELVAQEFDARRGSLLGQPFRLADGVSSGAAWVSENGVLALLPDSSPNSGLVMADRRGERKDTLALSAGVWNHPEFSPDGKRLAVVRESFGAGAPSDIWTIDLARNVAARVSFGPPATAPAWSADGSLLYYSSLPGGGLFRTPADGSGKPEELAAATASHHKHASPDGKWLAYEVGSSDSSKIWSTPLDGHARPTVLFETNSQNPRFSPDSRWIAYASDETGRFEIYVQSFPPGKGKWTISREGAWTARWRADGRELYYMALGGAVMAVDVAPRNGQLELGAARRLFDSGASTLGLDGYALHSGWASDAPTCCGSAWASATIFLRGTGSRATAC